MKPTWKPLHTTDPEGEFSSSRMTVLGYHEIEPAEPSYLYAVSCAQLERHLATLTHVATGAHLRIAVSFDDGHRSAQQYAAPLLDKYGIKAIFFVTAGWMGVEREYMDWSDLAELAGMGHQVHSHGWSHRNLTGCSDAELRDELERSRKTIEDRLGAAVDSISVPHGRWDCRILAACAEAGYTRVYTSNRISAKRAGSTTVIGRLIVKRTTSDSDIKKCVAGKPSSVWLAHAAEAGKRAARRVAGERLYHHIWRYLASDMTRDGDVVRPKAGLSILHLISTEGYYGAESMLLNLCRGLATGNHRTMIGVFDNSHNPHTELASKAKAEGLDVELIPCRGRLDVAAIRRIRRIANQSRANVIHTHGYKANFYGAVASAFSSVPLVTTYHIDWPDRGIRLHLYHCLDRAILRRFSRVVAVSDAIRRSLIRAGLDAERIAVIANGIDSDPFRPQYGMPAASTARVNNGATIGVAARLTPQKGLIYLFQAASEVLKIQPETMFVLAGEGPDRALLEGVASNLRIERNVIFKGHISDIPAFLNSIDIFVLPSLNEGMPMALLEAAAAGKPVIATRVGDIPKFVTDGETGLLVAPADSAAIRDALLSLLKNPQRRIDLGDQARRRVFREFSSEAMVRNYERVYVDATSSRDSQARGQDDSGRIRRIRTAGDRRAGLTE